MPRYRLKNIQTVLKAAAVLIKQGLKLFSSLIKSF